LIRAAAAAVDARIDSAPNALTASEIVAAIAAGRTTREAVMRAYPRAASSHARRAHADDDDGLRVGTARVNVLPRIDASAAPLPTPQNLAKER
jgi:hypothetical protein